MLTVQREAAGRQSPVSLGCELILCKQQAIPDDRAETPSAARVPLQSSPIAQSFTAYSPCNPSLTHSLPSAHIIRTQVLIKNNFISPSLTSLTVVIFAFNLLYVQPLSICIQSLVRSSRSCIQSARVACICIQSLSDYIYSSSVRRQSLDIKK